MKAVLFYAVLLFSVPGFAADVKNYACMTSDIVDMEVKITSADGQEGIEVVLTSPDDPNAPRIYKQTGFGPAVVSGALAGGKFEAVISKSDLQDVYGGAFLGAGWLRMVKTNEPNQFHLIFAAEDTVYQAVCSVE